MAAQLAVLESIVDTVGRIGWNFFWNCKIYELKSLEMSNDLGIVMKCRSKERVVGAGG
jgi:hypothetical protein